MDLKNHIVLSTFFLLLASCSEPKAGIEEKNALPSIFPDYHDVIIPVNIAPLNFRLSEPSGNLFVVIEGKNGKIEVKGKSKIRIPLKKWRRLLENNRDESLIITVFSRTEGKWTKFKPFSIHIKNNPVDPWLVYRLIAPGYEAWSEMGLYQRNLTSFKEEPIINNRLLPGSCMNCHSFNQNNPGQMMFHLRGNIGATMLVIDGEAVKLNTKTEETISNCVYPCWHPTGKYIGFSVNNISQVFHSRKEKRIEVFDSRSDIVVYDIDKNILITSKIISSDDSFETFPAFSPDGKTLFFCSAPKSDQPDNYDKVKYSLCSISFEPDSGTFGDQIDTLVSSSVTGKSVSLPRVSPDGKYLIFTMSDYGNFSIWHKEADLYQLDLNTRSFRPIDPVNSDDTESYHSWSSDSRWMVFSSRRIDGLYTRPYITFVDENGNFGKPFLLPRKDPDYYDSELRSFNVPEFITGKVMSDGRTMLKSIASSGKNVTFELKE